MTHYHDRLERGEFAAKASEDQEPAAAEVVLRREGSYDDLSVEELRELARTREIDGRSKLTTKPDLVGALEAADAEKAGGDD